MEGGVDILVLTEWLHKRTWLHAHTLCLSYPHPAYSRSREPSENFRDHLWQIKHKHLRAHTYTLPNVSFAAFLPLGIYCQSLEIRSTLPPFSLSPSLSELALRALRYFHLGVHQWEFEWLRETEQEKVVSSVWMGITFRQRRWLKRQGCVFLGLSRAYVTVTVSQPRRPRGLSQAFVHRTSFASYYRSNTSH